jgi:tRNA-2-methylthio-N6-dimethylallyladenosine synthase
MTEEMMRRFGAVPKVMPWLHVPAQSGSDAVLARMKRTYTSAGYREVVGWARRHVPGVELTSDFIVGFPGETDAEFEETLRLVEETRFVQSYVFKYSVRPNTLAARRLEDDVPEEVKRERNLALLEAQDRVSIEENRALVGRRVEVLVEGPSKTDPSRGTGRTPGNRLVHVAGAAAMAGRLVVAEVTEGHAHSCLGDLVAAEPEAGRRWDLR